MIVVWDNVKPTEWEATVDWGDGPRKIAWVLRCDEPPEAQEAWTWHTAASMVGGDQQATRTWPTAQQAMTDCDLELRG